MATKRNYNFIPLKQMKDKYTPAEWSQRETDYINSVNSIQIPFEPDDLDITSINAMIDSIYSIAKIEQSIYARLYEKMYLRRKNSETEVYLIVKRNMPKDVNGNAPKTTEGEMKALGIEYLKNTPVDGTTYSIYQMEEMAQDRKIFLDAIVDVLRQKSDKLITDSGALKLSVQIAGKGGNGA